MSPPDDAERAARLAAALRENLKRRKAQSRGRSAPSPLPAQEPAPETENGDATGEYAHDDVSDPAPVTSSAGGKGGGSTGA